MTKIYNNKFKENVITIFPGELYVSSTSEIISTVLGSCISVCLYDLERGVGGMNHFMLPDTSHNASKLYTKDLYLNMEEFSSESMKYGVTAMDVLIFKMQESGARRKNLIAKVFGGGNVIRSMQRPTIGEMNINFAKSYLRTEKIPIESESISDNCGRKIFFLSGSKAIFVKKLPIQTAIDEEKEYKEHELSRKMESDITIY